MTSKELTEWQAYERFSGPLGTEYTNEALAQLNDHLHDLLYLTSQAHFTDKAHRKGPIEKRETRYTRADEVYTLDY